MRTARTNGHLAALIVNCVVFGTSSAVYGRPAHLSGVYSNVFRHPETQDLLGTEIEIHASVRHPYAFVTLCEGGCNQSYRVPVTIVGNRIELSFAEQYVQYPSRLPAEKITYRITGRLSGRTLKVRLQGGAYSSVEWLPRREKRFGLAIAHPAPEER